MRVILGRAKMFAAVLFANVLCVESFGEHLIPQQTLCTGVQFSCVLHDAKLQCWGNSKDPMIYSDFKNPKQINCGVNSVCVLDDEGVSCWWRMGNFGKMEIPTFVNPRQISSGWGHRCVLDEKGVQCWHPDPNIIISGVDISPPFLKNPRQVATTADASCALTDEGIRCWGKGPPEPLAKIGENAQLFGGFSSLGMCILDGGEEKCWATYTKEIQWFDVPVLNHPRHIGLGITGGFAVDLNGVHWLGTWVEMPGTELEKQMPSDIGYSTEVSVGMDHACAKTEAGVRCWGSNTYGQSDVPKRLLAN